MMTLLATCWYAETQLRMALYGGPPLKEVVLMRSEVMCAVCMWGGWGGER